MDRFTKRIGENIVDISDKYVGLSHKEIVRELFRRLSDYEDMEERGLLIHLPCPIGTPIYMIKEYFEDFYDGDSYYKYVGEEKFEYCMIESVGKDVFLTIEEAEEQLDLSEEAGSEHKKCIKDEKIEYIR